MKKNKINAILSFALLFVVTSCGIPKFNQRVENRNVPSMYLTTSDTNTIASIQWRDFFNDSNLVQLIDTALANNQEFNIVYQEVFMRQNEVSAKKGEILPSVSAGAGLGAEKVGRYTRDGAVEANLEIAPDTEFPEPLQDYQFGISASWEVDIWRKLRNSRDAAVNRYLASVDGQKFLKTLLIEEVATTYYELIALDKQLSIIQDYIQLQSAALRTVKQQKIAGEVTELAVKRFEAEVLSTKTVQFELQQRIVEVENHMNFLLGRFPQPVPRSVSSFDEESFPELSVGIPAQLLDNRMDVQQAAHELEAAKLDVKVAKARFYPSLDISAGLGFKAFNPALLVTSPQSLLYSAAGELAAPLINRKEIKALYQNANAQQLQAVFEYEQTVLKAYLEVYNELSQIQNVQQSYATKTEEVMVLNNAIKISNDLFTSARADYMEVLMTQRDALDAKLEQVAYRKEWLISIVTLYKACGGGL